MLRSHLHWQLFPEAGYVPGGQAVLGLGGVVAYFIQAEVRDTRPTSHPGVVVPLGYLAFWPVQVDLLLSTQT